MAIDLPRAGVWSGLDHLTFDDALGFVRRVEDAGFGTFWTREGFGRDPFVLLAAAARQTRTLVVGTGIANVYARDAVATRGAASTVHEASGGRFILGLGVSHRPWVEGVRRHDYGPAGTVLGRYLDDLEAAEYRVAEPFGRPPVVLAALRPRLTALARDRTAGAFPYLTPVEGVAKARAILDAHGAHPWLIAALPVLPVADRVVAREAARKYISTYLGLTNYVAALRQHGYGDDDFGSPPSDRLVDALVAWGSREAIVSRTRALADAGADQVAIVPLSASGVVGSIEAVEELAPPW